MFHPNSILTFLLLLPILMWGQSPTGSYATLGDNTYPTRTLTDEKGKTIQYHIAGDSIAANPYVRIPSNQFNCNRPNLDPSISYATLNQLGKDPELLEACTKVINTTLDFQYPIPQGEADPELTICCINREIIFGTGYFQWCYTRSDDVNRCYRTYVGKEFKDLTLTKRPARPNGSYGNPIIIYRLYVDLESNTIYVAEIDINNNHAVKEINTCVVKSIGFEEDMETGWERPYPNGNALDACAPVGSFPKAVCTATPTQGTTYTTFEFDASNSMAEQINGQGVAAYLWEFPDGSTTSEAKTTYTFTETGTQTVRLTITDSKGESNTTSCPVTVTPGQTTEEDALPVAVCKVTIDESGDTYVANFDGSESRDNDENGASIVNYFWDFGDNSGIGSGPISLSHTYATANTYPASLTVTDDEGNTATAACPVSFTPLPEEPEFLPPVSIFTSQPSQGVAPLTVNFDGTPSYDQDEEGKKIDHYKWYYGDGTTGEGRLSSHSYPTPGTYIVKLRVTDNERDTAISERGIVVTPPATTGGGSDCCCADTCYTTILTLRTCGREVDTISRRSIRVPCPAPSKPVIVYAGECDEPVEEDPLQLAGGTHFRVFRGQITEYGLGVNAQIRYRHGKNRRWAVLADLGVSPIRKALPLDDRPYKWSPLRDSIDTNTALPLVWYRGTNRGTANGALGFEFAPFKWSYVQVMGGLERSFNQIEVSDPAKFEENAFIGYNQDILYVEPRVGVRKKHLEIFYSIQFMQENRPFVLIDANNIGGSHNRITDKTHNFGVLVYF